MSDANEFFQWQQIYKQAAHEGDQDVLQLAWDGMHGCAARAEWVPGDEEDAAKIMAEAINNAVIWACITAFAIAALVVYAP